MSTLAAPGTGPAADRRLLPIGPLLRHVGETEATVWVETARPGRVRVRDAESRTFTVEGHHYALVHVGGLEPATVIPYDVLLDGERAGGGIIRTPAGDRRVLAFGSCRLAGEEAGADALRGLARRMAAQDPGEWPDGLLLLGDQVYADDVSPATRAFIRARRGTGAPPGDSIADFEEYTRLYRESWTDPEIAWLLSVVPSAMIFDDHDVIDDWNTSAEWVAAQRAQPWWAARIEGGFMSYWLHQHLGNLAPAEHERDEALAAVRAHAEDAGDLLRDFARRADRDPAAVRWSFERELGPARLLVVDSRAARVLEPGGRSMLDPVEWAWLDERVRGGVDHLLVASSVPLFVAPATHWLEAWNEAVCDGAWGSRAARAGEWLRQALDLEHWAAFGASFERLCGMLAEAGAGRRGARPASIVALSGDVHHAYLARVAFPGAGEPASPVWQATCSPLCNRLRAAERRAVAASWSRPAHLAARALGRLAHVQDPPARWLPVHDRPFFDHHVAMLTLDGRRARLAFERAVDDAAGEPRLEPVFEHALGDGSSVQGPTLGRP